MSTGCSVRKFNVCFHDIQLLAAFLVFLLIPLKSTGIIHYVILLGAAATLGNIVYTLCINKVKKRYLAIFAALALNAAVSLLTTDKLPAEGLLYAMVCYFLLFWMIALNNTFLINKHTVEVIYAFGIASGILFAAYSLMPFAYYRDDNTISPMLTLYFGNSNLTGIYIFAVVCILLVYMRTAKIKWPTGLLTVYLLYLLWKTGARTCIFAAMFVIGGMIALILTKRKISGTFAAVCFALPILFVPAYLMLFRSGAADTVILGKTLFTGRQVTYREYLALLENGVQWIVGNLCEAGLNNAHNAPLAHLCSTGLFGTVLFYGMMLKKILTCTENENPASQTALLCLIGMFMQSSGEASLFLGGFPGSVFVYIFFCLAGRSDEIQA